MLQGWLLPLPVETLSTFSPVTVYRQALVSISDSVDMDLSQSWERVEDRGAWHAAAHGVSKSQAQLGGEWTTVLISATKKIFMEHWELDSYFPSNWCYERETRFPTEVFPWESHNINRYPTGIMEMQAEILSWSHDVS